ncbi:MAG TPA: cation diffusion facilitator family transporter [Anaerolineae bacterium]|nr:cation diffusion facilitator family transporter [Anaerolineae bacterium]
MIERRDLWPWAGLSLLTAVATFALKIGAYYLTGSISFLSDGMEASINVVAAVMMGWTLVVAARPPDEEHTFGHTKVEYLAVAVEGGMIILAAMLIWYTAWERWSEPIVLTQLQTGLLVSFLAGGLNLIVGRLLIRVGEKQRCTPLVADGKHLLTDVWTSVGVWGGVAAVSVTGWQRLDPIVASLVAIYICYTGYTLVREAILGLIDSALPETELAQIKTILDKYEEEAGITYHALRTRQAGAQRFVSFHIQVPGVWSVQMGHTLVEEIEDKLREELAPVSILTHIEPQEDPLSWQDIALNRE